MTATRIENRNQSTASHATYDIDRPILVVEDQDSISQYTTALIKDRWNCEVLQANSFQSAEEIIKSTHPLIQVAICDLNLPDAPHGEIVDLMSNYNIATIALTGAFNLELRESLNKKGIIDFIEKKSVNAFEYAILLAGRIQKNHRVSVLIVDDSISSRALYMHMCEALRIHVFTANDGKQALAVLDQHPEISLLLTDYAMPEMDGFDLTSKVRSRLSKDRMAIIGVSASSQEEMPATFLKCGANDYLAKPFSFQEFHCRIHQNLDVLDLIRSNQDAAQRDYMTRLFNRRHFFEMANKIHAEARKQQQPLVVAMIDLDFFKKVNDVYGHDCGDAVIKHFAAHLENQLGANLVARFGGEEFVALLAGTQTSDAREQLENLCRAVESSAVDCGANNISYTVSIGMCDQLGETIDDMLKGADIALYKAKSNGRNQVF